MWQQDGADDGHLDGCGRSIHSGVGRGRGGLVFRHRRDDRVPKVYRMGPCLLRAQVAIRRPIWPRSTAPTGETASGRFKILGPEEVLFRPHVVGLGIHTPFPFKGIVRWQGVQANVEGRPLLASIVFFGAWLVGWTMGGMLALHRPLRVRRGSCSY